MTGQNWRIDLPVTRPLSLNDRTHWRTRARAVADLRALAKWKTIAAKIPPCGCVRIELHYIPRDKRRRDPLNLVASLKAIEDGIVDAGVIPDDTPEHSIPTMPVIDQPNPNLAQSRIYILIREVTP